MSQVYEMQHQFLWILGKLGVQYIKCIINTTYGRNIDKQESNVLFTLDVLKLLIHRIIFVQLRLFSCFQAEWQFQKNYNKCLMWECTIIASRNSRIHLFLYARKNNLQTPYYSTFNDFRDQFLFLFQNAIFETLSQHYDHF